MPNMGRAGHPSPSVRFLPTGVNWPDGQAFIHPTTAPANFRLSFWDTVSWHLEKQEWGWGSSQALEPSMCGPTEMTKKLCFPAQPSTSEVGEGLRARGVDSCRRAPEDKPTAKGGGVGGG